ncbi:amidase domain-containing protein [Gordonia sp. DT30]|uniref:amidase domain-containing protein n=1 Tax=Gordonia sp. DT30 TaxID=3416546 RepID=UPI003CFA9E02
MVNFVQLRDARPHAWTVVAEDVLAAAKHCERMKDDIHDNGTRPLARNWSGSAYEMASKTLTDCASETEVLAILARSAVDPLDTLAHAVSIAQEELHTGIGIATRAGLTVNQASGQVELPSVMPPDPNEELLIRDAQKTSQQVINDAIEAATQADELCTGALRRTDRADPATTRVRAAQGVQNSNEVDALQSIRDTLPDGLTPGEVAKWWEELTPKDKYDLERACPVELYDLKGVPNSVKAQIDRPGLGYSSVGTVRYAQKNWANTSLDEYNDNCTNFVSDSLAYGGGMRVKSNSGILLHNSQKDWDDGTDGANNIFPTLATRLPFGIGNHMAGVYHTPTWGAAQNNHDFFMDNGGEEVPVESARPGDIMYFQSTQAVPSEGISAGNIHHAAIVTGVLPDGDVLYTQHTDSATDYSLSERMPEVTQNEGGQIVKIVKPRVTW